MSKILQETKVNVDNTKDKFKTELAITVLEEDWKDTCERIFKTTESKYWKELALKLT